MNRVIHTNLPDDAREFIAMQKFFDAIDLPFQLCNSLNTKGIQIEPYINNNNVFFVCVNERDQRQKAIESACSSLHRIIINFDLVNTSERLHD